MGSRLICYLSATVFLVTVSWVSNAADDCAAAYLDFMERAGNRASTISPEQLARSHRSALRIYYACETGHLQDTEGRFRRLEATGSPL
jgi:hypothetical protein